ncbi:MAG: hypothetical protein PHY92_10685 [Alphaproteobacteria bacterium]|nr:hypothetical protein [Alphaproteobacteria bacterium]
MVQRKIYYTPPLTPPPLAVLQEEGEPVLPLRLASLPLPFDNYSVPLALRNNQVDAMKEAGLANKSTAIVSALEVDVNFNDVFVAGRAEAQLQLYSFRDDWKRAPNQAVMLASYDDLVGSLSDKIPPDNDEPHQTQLAGFSNGFRKKPDPKKQPEHSVQQNISLPVNLRESYLVMRKSDDRLVPATKSDLIDMALRDLIGCDTQYWRNTGNADDRFLTKVGDTDEGNALKTLRDRLHQPKVSEAPHAMQGIIPNRGNHKQLYRLFGASSFPVDSAPAPKSNLNSRKRVMALACANNDYPAPHPT